MADTPAERQRRSRAHKAGNHLFCLPRRCAAAAAAAGASEPEPVTAVTSVTSAVTVTPEAPDVTSLTCEDFGPRGNRLWRGLLELGPPTPARRVLMEEACRIVDRLDRLDAVLRGDAGTWLRLREDVESGEVTLVIDKVLAEARQQELALKQIVAELRQSGAADKPTAGGGVLDQLAARRAARLADTTG